MFFVFLHWDLFIWGLDLCISAVSFVFFIENNVSRQYTMIQLKYLHHSERTRLRCSLSPGGRGLCSAVKPSIHVLRMLSESPNITLRFEHQLSMQPQSSLTSIMTRIVPHVPGTLVSKLVMDQKWTRDRHEPISLLSSFPQDLSAGCLQPIRCLILNPRFPFPLPPQCQNYRHTRPHPGQELLFDQLRKKKSKRESRCKEKVRMVLRLAEFTDN